MSYNNSSYWLNKDINKKKALDMFDFINKHEEYSELVNDCFYNTEHYSDRDIFEEECRDTELEIILESIDIVSALFKYNMSGKVCVLNFASYTEPGGKFLDGSMAQEESLCHRSILYNVLYKCNDSYYEENKKSKNRGLYTNKALFTPEVLFFSNNNEFYSDVCASVITCAAPNMNVGKKYCNVSDSENSIYLRSRIKFILQIADHKGIDTLILGAFGCGVFKQDAKEVARLFKEELNKVKINKVIFAIPDKNSYNYLSFKDMFK